MHCLALASVAADADAGPAQFDYICSATRTTAQVKGIWWLWVDLEINRWSKQASRSYKSFLIRTRAAVLQILHHAFAQPSLVV
jgi:hypothetical protein